ncbi:MAG: hypothetical protein ABS68_07805 [Niastella sp. SCN 39-18]|nr:MAG: hypothetical protein ABS68_07805 [Niastella sp. SCN 39-18]OJW11624.1 MAG: hypothetical protein BGO53_11875 [Sphingobacteriales bacterium 39-19]
MTIPKIQQYSPKNSYPAFTLFALCKGLNSGKPLEKPCPNCFAIFCRNEEEFDLYKSVIYGLWFTKGFHPLLTGSVIEFIRIADFKNLVLATAERLRPTYLDFSADAVRAKNYERLQKKYLAQAALVADLRRAILYRHLRR